MLKPLLALLSVLAVAACQQLPQSTSPTMHSYARLIQPAAAGGSGPALAGRYDAAIVKDLEIVDAGVGALRGELARLFSASFRETLQREGYVGAALSAESGADVVIIQPAVMRVSVGSRSELEIAVAVREPKGRLIEWYAVEYGGALPDAASLPRAELLRRVFADAGEKAASAIATAR